MVNVLVNNLGLVLVVNVFHDRLRFVVDVLDVDGSSFNDGSRNNDNFFARVIVVNVVIEVAVLRLVVVVLVSTVNVDDLSLAVVDGLMGDVAVLVRRLLVLRLMKSLFDNVVKIVVSSVSAINDDNILVSVVVSVLVPGLLKSLFDNVVKIVVSSVSAINDDNILVSVVSVVLLVRGLLKSLLDDMVEFVVTVFVVLVTVANDDLLDVATTVAVAWGVVILIDNVVVRLVVVDGLRLLVLDDNLGLGMMLSLFLS